jgi:uncharacterized protein (TIGR02186 family)
MIAPDFEGSEVVFFGAVDRSRLNGERFDIAITVRGPVKSLTVWRKERRGLLWVNAESRTFDAVPSLYLVLSTAPVAAAASIEERQKFGLGLDTLTLPPVTNGNVSAATPVNLASVSNPFLEALLRSKQRAKLYAENGEAVKFTGRNLFRAKAFIPPEGGPGLYRVNIFLIQNGKIISSAVSHVRLEKTGIERFISMQSERRPWMYGIAAVLLAMAVGGIASAFLRRN